MDEKHVISAGFKCEKELISQNFQEVHVMKDKTGSDLRKGSKGKLAYSVESLPRFITVWGNYMLLYSCQTCADTKKLKPIISN